jgi:energy-coupling factor transporter ATP-binding protein EcfA2
MRLHRLRVKSFAALQELDVSFGPGLNVLYGPNDLGKSTLAEAIRLALLLPHTSKSYEPYISWSGAADPVVDLTFETEAQRIWRVVKQFGKSGSSLLQESRNGQDFDDVERARGVDAKLREILGWGVPEPGGKGLPSSFLSTALLSTQANVTDILHGSLHDDLTPTGKDRIAAALQAVAQDPLFLALLREAQSHRDEAYTDKGAKKTARGSVLKVAADRVTEARKEKERLEKIVEDSESVEHHRRDLFEKRERMDHEHAAAADRLAAVELLARQAADRAAAADAVRLANDAVLRIRKMDHGVAEADRKIAELSIVKTQAEQALADAQAGETAAGDALAAAEESLRSAGPGSDMADTVARQALELRRIAAEQAAQEARQGIEAAAAVQELVDAAGRAENEHRQQEAEAVRAREKRAASAEAEQTASAELRRCDLLERALEARTAEKQVASAQAGVEQEAALQKEWKKTTNERTAAAKQRKAITVPPAGSLPALRKLATDLASARGALDVGLVMTVIPTAFVNVSVRKDGVQTAMELIAKPLEIEAHTEVEVNIGDFATVQVRGGRREAQEKVRALEALWTAEALPHLKAAGVEDLDALDAKINEARELDARLKALDADLESLRLRATALAGAAEALSEATARAAACRRELEDTPLDSLKTDLDALGPDPGAALRARRQKASREAEAARATAGEAATAQTLAEERARALRSSLETAVAARDAGLAKFPMGVVAASAATQETLRKALEEQETVKTELATLQSTIDAKKRQLEAALGAARDIAEKARRAVEAAQASRMKAIADLASEEGRRAALRKVRAAEDLTAAESTLREATERHGALPIPEHPITPDEVAASRDALARAKRDLDTVDREIHIAQGRLQQVGGAVARDQLRDALEAFELADRQEHEIEADYEAWRLLLDQMKEADAAQASNLGQALAPALAGRFQALTRKRYQNVHLTAQLGTEGVLVAGKVRSPDLLSVGTREQLSTLYRLCLGEYLQTTIVLDDQLVQSDDTRMEWFRALLAEKARGFQIIVFTCRPGDYLAPSAMVGEGGAGFADSEEGFVRAIDLGRGRV